jgi:hypothetical protein
VVLDAQESITSNSPSRKNTLDFFWPV